MWPLHCRGYRKGSSRSSAPWDLLHHERGWQDHHSPSGLFWGHVLASSICEYNDPAWEICALSESLQTALCRELPRRYYSPSHPVQPWTAGLRQQPWRGSTDPFSSWESKACWRRCWGLIRPQSGGKLVILGTCCRAWEEDGASAEWLLGCCIPATLGKQIKWPDWEMTDPCQNCEQLPSILCPSLSTSCSGFGSVEVLLSSSSFTPAQLNCGDPFGMLVRKQLMPAWLRRGSTCRDSPAKRSPGKAIPPYSGIHSSSFGNNQLFW